MAPTMSKLSPDDPTRFLTTIEVEDTAAICVFCKSSKLDDVNLGVMYEKDGIVTHYFCMLLAAALKQNGDDHEGILGFLPVDILKEVKRTQRVKCFYCGNIGASVGCCNKRCKIIFHLPCGIQNGTNSQFHTNFESYCPDHAKHKQFNLDNNNKESCPICMCEVNPADRIVRASCCKGAIFHKECIQRMATSSGYLFKCPTCNKTKSFVHEMKSLGIFVPDQDASWEKENAFQELYVRYSHCDAPECFCTEGRDFGDSTGNWSLARCRLCGAQGVHKHCGHVGNMETWACDSCLEVELKADSQPKTEQPRKPHIAQTVPLPRPTTSRVGTPAVSRKSTPAIPRKRKVPKTPVCQVYEESELTSVTSVPRRRSTPTSENTPSTSGAPTKRRRYKSPRKPASLRKKSKTIAEMEAEEVMCDTIELLEEEEAAAEVAPPAEDNSRVGTGRRRKRYLWSAGCHNATILRRRLMRRKQQASHRVTKPEDGEEEEGDGDGGSGVVIPVAETPVVDPSPVDNDPEADEAGNESPMEEAEGSGIELIDLSHLQDAETVDWVQMDQGPKPILPPPPESVSPEPTPEQIISFKALGDRLRAELSQNRGHELSPPRVRPSYFGEVGYKDLRRRKQWFSPEQIKERQVMMGDPEL